MTYNRSPLAGIHLSKNLKHQLQDDPADLSPMAITVRLRAQLMDLGYRVLLLTPLGMLIASPERPNRFICYTIHSAQRFLEKQYE